MTISECYEQMGSDFNGVMSRLGSETIIAKFAVKFLSDPSYDELKAALEEGRAEDAFRAAHTLKGVSLNLGFDKLYETSSALTEKLRGRKLEGTDALMKQVTDQYQATTAALREYQGI